MNDIVITIAHGPLGDALCTHPYAKTLLAPGPVARFCPDCNTSLPVERPAHPSDDDAAVGIKPFFYAVADNEGRPVMDEICCCESPGELEECFQDRIDDLTARVVPVYTAPQIEKMRDEIAAQRAQIEALTKERDEAQGLIHFAETAQGEATAERDKALADLASICDQLGACKHYGEMGDGLSGAAGVEVGS